MDYAIKIENLTKQFMGLKALDDLSLEFPSGQTTRSDWPQRFLGKTTLMNVLTGMLVPENGMIEINERRFRKIKPNTLRRLKIARTFQDGRLIEQLSVEDNLLLPVARKPVIGTVCLSSISNVIVNVWKTFCKPFGWPIIDIKMPKGFLTASVSCWKSAGR